MKNIEKWPNTADAMETWNAYKTFVGSDISFTDWLVQNYDELNRPSLLDAAKAARDWMEYGAVIGSKGSSVFRKLTDAVLAEETRPKRNFERFATAEEAFEAFRKACIVQQYKTCHLKNKIMARTEGYVPCTVRWLYSSDPNLLRNEGAECAGRAEEKSEEAGALED